MPASKDYIFNENKEDIIHMLEETTKVEVAKKYGVSVETVRGWFKKKLRKKVRSMNKCEFLEKEYRAPKFYDLVFKTLNKTVNQEIFQ